MKKYVLTLFLACIAGFCLAQDSVINKTQTVYRTNHPGFDITEKYWILKSDKKTKQGLFQAFWINNTLLATGRYDNGSKVGIWRYNNGAGVLEQDYDYDNKKFIYLRLPDTAHYKFEPVEKIAPTDTSKSAVKIGGFFYGYEKIRRGRTELAIQNLKSKGFRGKFKFSLILSVNDDGVLIDLRLVASSENLEELYIFPLVGLTDEEKQFFPATVNGRQIASKVIIKSILNIQ